MSCQLSEKMGFKFRGFTVIRNLKSLGSTDVGTGAPHWEQLHKPRNGCGAMAVGWSGDGFTVLVMHEVFFIKVMKCLGLPSSC